MSKPSTIEETLLQNLSPGMKPAELINRVRKTHPEASKKEIIHAAFAAVIAMAEQDPEKAKTMQDFALRSRAP